MPPGLLSRLLLLHCYIFSCNIHILLVTGSGGYRATPTETVLDSLSAGTISYLVVRTLQGGLRLDRRQVLVQGLVKPADRTRTGGVRSASEMLGQGWPIRWVGKKTTRREGDPGRGDLQGMRPRTGQLGGPASRGLSRIIRRIIRFNYVVYDVLYVAY
eukprot:1142115-Pyramimonas_sp.AAC.2